MKLRMTRHPHDQPVVKFIDERLFPAIVGFAISRAHILFLVALIAVVENPLIGITIALAAGNWTNIVSATASTIVLRQQSVHHEEVTEHHEAHADAFDQILQRLDQLEQTLNKGATDVR